METGKILNLDLFPIPVTIGTLGESMRDLNSKLIEDCIHSVENGETTLRTGVNVNQTLNYLENYYDSFNQLAAIIAQFCQPIIERAGSPSRMIKVEEMWANVAKNSTGFNMPHSHGADHMWTGVYYPSSGIIDGKHLSDEESLDELANVVSKSQPDPGSLVIMDPYGHAKSSCVGTYTERYPYWGNPVSFVPKESTIVLFPSYVPHMTMPTGNDDMTRISIAFQIKVVDN